jgi:hypothetical protein
VTHLLLRAITPAFGLALSGTGVAYGCPPPEPGLAIVVSQPDSAHVVRWNGREWRRSGAAKSFQREPWPAGTRGGEVPDEVSRLLRGAEVERKKRISYRGMTFVPPVATLVTPTAALVAAGIQKPNDLYLSPTSVGIVDSSSGDVVVFRLVASLVSLGWSPSGTYLAIVTGQGRYKTGLLGAIAGYFGHPIPLETLTLEVRSRSGDEICSQVLIRDLAYGDALVMWASQ